jgi:hypothetical protein
MLKGYVLRMGTLFGKPLLSADLQLSFAAALRAADNCQDLLERVQAEIQSLGFMALLNASRSQLEGLGLRRLAVGSVYIDGLKHELEEFEALARGLDLKADAAPALFLLAYAGHLCMRGWKYTASISQHEASDHLVYLAHRVRAAFLHATRQEFSFSVAPPGRLFFWSWGNLFAWAVEQQPSRWSAKALQDALNSLRSALHAQGTRNSIDKSVLNIHDPSMHGQVQASAQLAREHGLLPTGNDQDASAAWASALARLLPAIGPGATAELLETVAGEPVAQSLLVMLDAHDTGSSPMPRWLEGSTVQLDTLFAGTNGSPGERIARVALS